MKVEIVTKYFWAWAKIMSTRKDSFLYIDLFSGPGVYKNGDKSTPVQVLEKACSDPILKKKLITMFNDVDRDNIEQLDEAIKKIDGIDDLTYPPAITSFEVGQGLTDYLSSKQSMLPTLLFVDPWGYKGMSLDLIDSVLKHWGCDCIFFFNYNRINMALPNPLVDSHMDELFGYEVADALRSRLSELTGDDREFVILEAITSRLKSNGTCFVLPFCFKSETGKRVSHHLIFATKSPLAYKIMKEIMCRSSSTIVQGVGSFEFSEVDMRFPTLFGFTQTLDDLIEMLPKDFSGKRLSVEKIFESHHLNKPYTMTNYKEALRRLEEAGLVTCEPPAAKRRMRSGVRTLPDSTEIQFR